MQSSCSGTVGYLLLSRDPRRVLDRLLLDVDVDRARRGVHAELLWLGKDVFGSI